MIEPTCKDKLGGFDLDCPCDNCKETQRALHEKHLGTEAERTEYTTAIDAAYAKGAADERELLMRAVDLEIDDSGLDLIKAITFRNIFENAFGLADKLRARSK